ncbi:MAG: ABC transporter substrate-binding protein [Alphaproteobacteria bacterium]|nr:ABC transporter substrate-binding protein [Alphaproteobacteria bacterium]
MKLNRRALLAAAASTTVTGRLARAQTQTIKIGVLNDQSGTYRDATGPTSVICTRQAIEEFAPELKGFNVEVLVADHKNRPDLAATFAKQWIDREGVVLIQDGGASSCALLLASICRERNIVFLSTSTATSALTGEACSPNTVHWVYDTWALAQSTGTSTVKSGGDSWFFISADYTFGHILEHDTAEFVLAAGGKVLGNLSYPFPETTDFSAQLLRAQASGAKVLGLANAGTDTFNCVKQAHEFGLHKTMKIAALLGTINEVHGLGLEVAQGLRLSEAFYWDLNDRTRAFAKRVTPKTGAIWPNMSQAGQYSSMMHYLKTVTDMGPAEAVKDGASTVARMKKIPTDDDAFGRGRIREDGRKIHPFYLFEAKKPEESKHSWDLLKLVATTPAEEAFRPLDRDHCSFAKA